MYDRVKEISKSVWNHLVTFFSGEVEVYFISGMCYNCSVFDKILLPKGYKKNYIEWEIPSMDESLHDYALKMAKSIKPKRRTILVGYSFGGIVAQEIAKFVAVEKIILISTMKDEHEIPALFHMAKRVNFADNLPMKIYSQSDFMINLFNRYIYSLPTQALEGFMTVTDPIYLKWSLKQITHWMPDRKFTNIYHIHGTKDQVFPYEKITAPITVKGGDHLMILKRFTEINKILNDILTKEEVIQKASA